MKRCLLRLLKMIACFVALFSSSLGAMAAENMRFLILVDHSPEMATRQISTVQTIYNLVSSGFDNQIQPDEQFALWFYGSRLQTNAPLTWQTGREIALARQSANLFTGRIYSRLRPREQTLRDAAPIIAASSKLTVLIFTDGSQPLSGTPYDAAINSAMEQRRMLFMQADKPFVIALLAKKGQLVSGNVHTDVNAAYHIPDLEHPTELLDKALAAVRTASAPKTSDPREIDKAREALRDALAGKTKPPEEAPIPVAALQFAPTLKEVPKEPAPPPQPPKEEPKKEEPKKEEPKKEEPKEEKPQPQVVVVATPTPEPPKAPEPKVEPPPQKPEPIVSKPVEVVATTPVVKAPEPEPAPVPREEPKRIVREEASKPVLREEPKPSPTPTPPPVAKIEEAPKPAPVVAPTQTNAAPTKPQPQPPIQTAVVTPRSNGFPLPILVGGFFAIAVGGGFAFLHARRRAKSAGSIISQALPPSGPTPWRK